MKYLLLILLFFCVTSVFANPLVFVGLSANDFTRVGRTAAIAKQNTTGYGARVGFSLITDIVHSFEYFQEVVNYSEGSFQPGTKSSIYGGGMRLTPFYTKTFGLNGSLGYSWHEFNDENKSQRNGMYYSYGLAFRHSKVNLLVEHKVYLISDSNYYKIGFLNLSLIYNF